ncbi:MAG: tRNA (N(6)-L-threonylcarbamoyladenosine(37)-C(2))-methylthiotransferase MtaB [Nitrospirae bacterium]|nr:tRNA (N(6)-L-threonylcarbamoyladenosine(37)-C(2))-methylthiotransferase MtaB [Nitrospirota bacterium]
MKVSISTLGCKVNQAESASIEDILRGQGHEVIPLIGNSSPDVCIINTCTVTAKSDYQSRQLIRKAVRTGAKVIATGCYAQLRQDELSGIAGVSLILGNSLKEKLPEYIDKLPAGLNAPALSDNSAYPPLALQPYFSRRARAFLKIQDGCNFSCSYCAVPMARGKSRSLSSEDVLHSVQMLAADGFEEIVLTGVHIGNYGMDLHPKISLVEIVDNIVKKYSSVRIRLSSIEPQEFKKELLSLINSKSVCHHIHIPLQSGSDNVLKLMNRRYSAAFFKDIVNCIAATCPQISIGTDVIVGFPGETEKDFKDTEKILTELPLSYIHVFPYSKRKGTAAEAMPGHIDSAVKRKRMATVIKLAEIKKNIYTTRHLGEILDVIVENKSQTSGFYYGTSDNYLKVLIEGDNLTVGKRIQVKAVSFTQSELLTLPLHQHYQYT